jgi:hypothetical protein
MKRSEATNARVNNSAQSSHEYIQQIVFVVPDAHPAESAPKTLRIQKPTFKEKIGRLLSSSHSFYYEEERNAYEERLASVASAYSRSVGPPTW